MAKSKPKVNVRRAAPVPEAEAVALENRWAARDALPAGSPLPTKARPGKPASLQAGEPSEGRSVQRKRGAWTKAEPYTRKDGTQTRGTTVYLPTDLAERLRRFAFETDRKQSEIIGEALAAYLDRHGAKP